MRVEDGLRKKDLHSQVIAMLERKRTWLKFPSLLEKRFEDNRRTSRNHHSRASILIALVIYDLFLFCDFRLLPQHFVRCLIIRLAVVTPITFGSYVWLHFNPPKRLRESLILIVSCIVGFSTLYIWHDVSAVASAVAQTALILLIIFVNTIMRLSFWHALTASTIAVLTGAFFLYQDPWLAQPEKIILLSLVVTGVVFTLVAAYSMERDERTGFLLRMQLEARRQDLSSANRDLTRLSNLDVLTGVANRRYFSHSVEKAWDDAVLTQESVSLLLIDIDHFKRINDAFGHLYGDETLAQLGKVLRQGLRRDEGIAARFGGDEFVVLLPHISLDKALIIAERLRRLARRIDLPAQDGAKAPMTTVSIGAATARPNVHHHLKDLLRDADTALYQAKASGRDRIWPPLPFDGEFEDRHFLAALEELGHLVLR
jgi:diguanylate cyclase (GGDEF)-like protein